MLTAAMDGGGFRLHESSRLQPHRPLVLAFLVVASHPLQVGSQSCRRIRLSGHACSNELNQVYRYAGNTADGRPFFCGERGKGCLWHDRECDRDDNPNPIWMVSFRRPNVHSSQNLDGSNDGCHNEGNFESESFEPPLGPRKWNWMWCESYGCGDKTMCLTCMDNVTEAEVEEECEPEECEGGSGWIILILLGVAGFVGAIIVVIVIVCCCCKMQAQRQQQMSSWQQSLGPGAPGANLRHIPVQCPPGVGPGQALQVQDPITGQMLQVVIPEGVQAGGTFMVQAPAPAVAVTVVGTPVLTNDNNVCNATVVSAN